MDTTKQAEDLMRSWMDVQQRTWENWFKTVQGIGANQAAEMWDRERKRSTESWERSIKQAMDAQAELGRAWMQNLVPQGGVASTGDLSQQGQEMLNNWNATQTQLWESYFATARQVLDLSERMLKQSLETQSQMLQAWMEQAAQGQESAQGSKKK